MSLQFTLTQVPEKLGGYQIQFQPQENGNYQAWMLFNESLLHSVHAVIKVGKWVEEGRELFGASFFNKHSFHYSLHAMCTWITCLNTRISPITSKLFHPIIWFFHYTNFITLHHNPHQTLQISYLVNNMWSCIWKSRWFISLVSNFDVSRLL